MEKIELLEKLVAVQKMHIELMNDFNNLKFDYEVKIEKINNLKNVIECQNEKIIELNRQNEELKKQYEELQKSLVSVEIPNETPDETPDEEY